MATPPNEAAKLAILRQQMLDKIKQDEQYKQMTDRQYTSAIQPNPNWMPKKADNGVIHKDNGGNVEPSIEHMEDLLSRHYAGKKLNKAENEQLGLYHRVGGGKKLNKPISEYQFSTAPTAGVKMVPEKLITPEDLQGGYAIPFIGDSSMAGRSLTGAEGHEFHQPVELSGGHDYMRANQSEDPMKSAIWASAQGKITHLTEKAKRLKAGDAPVYGVHTTMSPSGVGFSHMPAAVLAELVKNSKITKKAQKEFNKEMKAQHPDFPGVMSEELHQMLMAPGAGELRKHFVQRMATEPYQQAGFPEIAMARLAVQHPNLMKYDKPGKEFVGSSIGQFRPDFGQVEEPESPHPSYPSVIGGKYVGALHGENHSPLLTTREFFPEFHKLRREFMAPESGDRRAFELSQPVQKLDQEWLDKVMPIYLKRRKHLLGYEDGGNVEPTIDEMQAALMMRKPAHLADGGAAKNTFDYENPEHVANVVNIAAQHKLLAPITDIHKHLSGILSAGRYKHIEDPIIQDAIKQAGHDSYYVAEKNGKQSHITRKADGGNVPVNQVGAEEAPSLPVKEYILPHGQHPGQLPVGGIDMQPAMPGQQLMPAQSPQGGQSQQGQQQAQQGGQPPQGGLSPQGAPQGQQPTSLSNILQMTQQGRAMNAMQPPVQKADGGGVTGNGSLNLKIPFCVGGGGSFSTSGASTTGGNTGNGVTTLGSATNNNGASTLPSSPLLPTPNNTQSRIASANPISPVQITGAKPYMPPTTAVNSDQNQTGMPPMPTGGLGSLTPRTGLLGCASTQNNGSAPITQDQQNYATGQTNGLPQMPVMSFNNWLNQGGNGSITCMQASPFQKPARPTYAQSTTPEQQQQDYQAYVNSTNKYNANPNPLALAAKKGGTIKPVGFTKEKVKISPNLDAMQYELMSVKHFKKAK